MGSKSEVVELVESLIPEKPAIGWSNEGLLEILRKFLIENPESCPDLYEYFKKYETHDIVDDIVKATVATCLAAFDRVFHQDIKDFLIKEEGWTQQDFDYYEPYREKK